MLLTKSFPAGFARVRAHRALGHRTVLITGALDFVIEPLRPLFDEVVCASLGVDGDGRFTGRLENRPPTGESRALVLAQYAADHDLDLGESVAYADSTSDLPLLECVGFPVAVNPEARLAAVARRRGWHVEQLGQGGRRGTSDPAHGPPRPRRLAVVVPASKRCSTPVGPRGPERSGSELKALVVERSVPRFAAARMVSSISGSGAGAGIGPLRLTDLDAPDLPGADWHRVRPSWPGSADRTWPPSTAGARVTSRTS